jgi:RNA polymerase sigma-70 factor (sigma-E family)
MSSSDDLVLGAPAEQEPLGELFGTVFELAGQAASRLTPDEVHARLRSIVRNAARPAAEPSSGRPGVGDAAVAGGDVDWAVSALYREHYRSLVRLAALLVRDIATAEEVVQDSFVAMHGGWRRLRDTDKALSYLRQTVVNRSRAVLRHRAVVERNAPQPQPDMPSAEHGAIALLERSAVVAALRTLPPRQREALVLRYYGNLSEAQIAGAMGISQGAVKSHTARAMMALRAVLEREG